MRKILIPFLLAFYNVFILNAQNQFTIDGYISQLGTSMFMKDSANATWDYVLHNRINLAWYASDKLNIKTQFRNQLLGGETIEQTAGYAKHFESDKGLVDLNWNWFNSNNSLLNTQVDRLYAEYINGKFELTLGRQRINWGRSLVWNPNDIFNAYSYYDFDYAEKPGADALRAVYYTGTAAVIELVAKVDSSKQMTIGALSKFNKWGYDIQFLGGYVNGEDFVIGTGWEGNINQFSLRGELSYYRSEKNFADTSGVFLATIGTDYSFGNSLMVQAEFLYNDKNSLTSLTQLIAAPNNSKSLSVSEYNFFVNVNYPVTPILSAYLAAMYYTDQNGYFLMPGFDLSLSNNLNFSLIYQYFNVEVYNKQRLGMNMAFARVKWNF
ncbi:MAG: hypothetical protein CVU09_15340 [Bacteroidetes bacterium HGW-Bacteroidetes-4]|jgi:hypothetical protein|nr:MAG: hypothetical protein CVU09_15340 [Bacteroidetes bacterium HGW-Bacteroidetes-4]